MSREAHTPGPWTAHHGWKDKFIEFDAEKHPHWCEVTGPEGGPYLSITGHFGIANARLIAAAPALLEAARTGRSLCLAFIMAAEQRGEPLHPQHAVRRDLEQFESAIQSATGGGIGR